MKDIGKESVAIGGSRSRRLVRPWTLAVCTLLATACSSKSAEVPNGGVPNQVPPASEAGIPWLDGALIDDAGAGGVSSAACPGTCPVGSVCNPMLGRCVGCVTSADCAPNGICHEGVCTATCRNSLDCAESTPICDPTQKRCVECAGAGDCDPSMTCVGNVCRAACFTDKTCVPFGLLCDLSVGRCTECLAHSDCPTDKRCNNGVCAAMTCTPGRAVCVGNDISVCNSLGTGIGPAAPCGPYGCALSAEGARCQEAPAQPPPPPPDAGGSTAPQTCAGSRLDYYCDTMPRFTSDTQVIDGVGDEFCNVPSVTYKVSQAPFAEGHHNGLPAPVDMPEVVTVRAGWSAYGFHLHAHVTDPAIYPAEPLTGPASYPAGPLSNLWDGDEIELIISGMSKATASCFDGAGPGALHLGIAPPAGTQPARAVVFGGSAKESVPLDPSLYAVRLVPDGYEVELRVPWPSSPAVAMPTNVISYHFGVSVADLPLGGRQLYGGVPVGLGDAGTCCSDAAPWCDGSMWCHPRLE